MPCRETSTAAVPGRGSGDVAGGRGDDEDHPAVDRAVRVKSNGFKMFQAEFDGYK